MRHSAVACLSLLIIFSPHVANAEDANTQPGWSGPDGALARSLFLKTRAAREKINSYSIEFKSTHEYYFDPSGFAGPNTGPVRIPAGIRVDVLTGTCHWDGKRFVTFGNADYSYEESRHRIAGPVGACLTDNYFALMSAEMPSVIRVQEHASIEALPKDRLQFALDWLQPNVLLYGFGDGMRHIDTHYDRFTHPILWTVTESRTEEGHTYSLEATSPKRPSGKPMVRYTIDADRGYMITSVNSYELDGPPSRTLTCTLQQVDKDTWFPQEVHTKSFLRGSKDEFILKITRAEVNRPIPVTTFTLDKFQYDPAVAELRRNALNGEDSLSYRWENTWVPLNSLPASRRVALETHIRSRKLPWSDQ